MAMARTTLNPFKCSGTPLPVPVLLMAKLVTLCILLSLEWKSFPDPFLPFIPAAGHLAIGPLFRWSLKLVFFTAAAALLFNCHVRTACLAIAFVFFTAVFSSRIYFENNRLFVGCLFFLAGLTETDGPPWLLRCQVVLLYFAAGMNKLLDPGWRSGLFFATWGGHFIKEGLYFRVAALLPALAMGKIFSWCAIGTELSLPIALLHRKSRTIAIWVGILFHTALLFLTGRTFGLFYFAVLASYLSFVEWPRSEVNVQKTCSGLTGVKTQLLYNPAVYFVIAAMLAVPEPDAFPYRRWLAMALWILFAPFFNPIGERVYDAFARNRHRLPGAAVWDGRGLKPATTKNATL